MLSLPAINISKELDLTHFPKHKAQLYSNGRQLLVLPKQVIVIAGLSVSKKLTFDEDVIAAMYTTLSSHEESAEALIVCLSTSAHVYFPQGNSYIVSIPFPVRTALPFDSGLLLEQENSSKLSLSPSSYRFFTLVDPIGELRVVTTSSTSVVSANESLVYFPARGLGKIYSLCATFNSRLRSMNIYHVKASNRNAKVGGSTTRKRRNPTASSPNPGRILEDDIFDSLPAPFPSVSISKNMDKKRTSTLLSGVSSIARMGSESTIAELKSSSVKNPAEFGVLRKDMIWTKVESIPVIARKLHIAVSGLSYEDSEAIVVSNRATREAIIYIYRSVGSSPSLYESTYRISCVHTIPLQHPQFPGWLIVLKSDKMLCLVHPFLDIVSPPISFSGRLPSMSLIASSFGTTVALRSSTENRSSFLINLVLEPKSELVLKCLKLWKYLSGSKLYEQIWLVWRSSLSIDTMKDEWNAFVMTILSLIYPFDEDTTKEVLKQNEITSLLEEAKVVHENFHFDYSFYDLLPYIVVTLHLIYEETKLDHLNASGLNRLGTLLTQLTVWMGWLENWTTYYMIDHANIDTNVKLLLVVLVQDPPNIFDYLISLFERKNGHFLKFSQVVEESDLINEIVTPRTIAVCNIFEMFALSRSSPDAVIKAVNEYSWTPSFLESLPPGISIPLKNYLSLCQEKPNFEWSTEVLELAGRGDLTGLLQSERLAFDKCSVSSSSASTIGRDVNSIISSIFLKTDGLIAWDGQSEADRISITKLIFDKDRRYYEITSLLHQTRVQTATLYGDSNPFDYDPTVLRRELAILAAARTLTLPLGRAALFYAGRIPLLTEKFPIPKFNFNTLVAPSMTKIVTTEGDLVAKFSKKVVEWGHFHNGVSSGLSISPHAKGISGSWVIFNKPSENNAQHAGFLLGLGLNGHLKKLEEWHIYNYLGPKHPLTSVGLLIGMAASIRGSMDNKLTKVLSVHAVALLPRGANDLNVPLIVQSAGLIGIGLLYAETQHRRMSEILLTQVGGLCSHVESVEEQESYRLAAGIGLGYINLGKGDDLRGLAGTHVIDKLLSYAVSMKDSNPVCDLDKSGSGSILALGLIYLKTRNQVMANKLQIPDSEPLLDYIRPDLLLLRCVSKNLILWDNIQPTKRWVESEIPEFLRKKYNLDRIPVLDSDQATIFNILGGICLSVAVKFASSQNEQARDLILHYLDIFMVISTATTSNYDQKIAFNSACQIQNLLALCAAVVMAGSGDLDVFRRLRVLHGRINDHFRNGSHMAYSMALGILFLGGSQYGFGSSNFAIASLVVSLYPVFPNEKSEHEIHLQVLRHFWALSVELRCLIVRDVKDGSPIKVPVKISRKDGSVEELSSPCLVTEMDQVSVIEVESKDFFRVKVDFQVNSEYLEKFKNSLTIYVLEKNNYFKLKSEVSALIEMKNRQVQHDETLPSKQLNQIRLLKIMNSLSSFEKEVYFDESGKSVRNIDSDTMKSGLSLFNLVDDKLELARISTRARSAEELRNLRLLFAYTDNLLNHEHLYVLPGFIGTLKLGIRQLVRGEWE